MTESLANAIKDIKQLSSTERIVLEAVGPRRDTYLNILPMLFDIDVVYKGKNQYLKRESCKNVSALFLDSNEDPFPLSANAGEDLDALCNSSLEIVKQDNEYMLKERDDIDMLEPLKAEIF